jgi:hypothetical protein
MKLHEQHPHETTIVELNNFNYDTGVKETDLNINSNNISLEELLSGMTYSGQYGHLRVILTKNDDHRMGQKYLWVSRSAFGLVKLNDISFYDNKIHLEIEDVSSGLIKSISLDVNDDRFRFILISWQDIRGMVLAENKTIFNNDEILEFDY